MNILGIGSHPDDLEILCGGTLAKYTTQNHKVTMAIVTDGSAGSTDHPVDELRKIRRKEAKNSAQIIGAELIWLGELDELFFEDKETRYKIVDVIRESKPDVIITHSPNDYHPDHQEVSKAVLNGSFISSLPHITTQFPNHNIVCPIYYMDTLVGVNFQPQEFVDITDFFEKKKNMLACHSSQLKWLKAHDEIDIIELIETAARYRGYQCGVKYAEAFQIAPYWPRIKPERFLP